MGTFQCFEEIEAWQKARVMAQQIYTITSKGPFSRDFGLRDQIRRAAVAAMSNIAEGFERDGTGEFLHFLSMAKGSLAEVQSHLFVALDQGYISSEDFDRLKNIASEGGRLTAGLMNYLRRSGLKGIKYRQADQEAREGQIPFEELEPQTGN